MTDLHIKVQPEVAQEFKKLSEEIFAGNESHTFQQAVQLLRSLRGGQHFERFWEIADQIREKVQQAGGISEEEIDRLVVESRARLCNEVATD